MRHLADTKVGSRSERDVRASGQGSRSPMIKSIIFPPRGLLVRGQIDNRPGSSLRGGEMKHIVPGVIPLTEPALSVSPVGGELSVTFPRTVML